MDYIEILLSPIVWLMRSVLEFYVSTSSSMGLSILLTSFTFSLVLLPLQKAARRKEESIDETIKLVDAQVQPLKKTLKGEELFFATEKIYEKNHYHPIKSIGLGLSFFVMLPVLLSAILLFTNDNVLANHGFLFISDLSRPDGLLGVINVLPLLMSTITIVDARLRYKDDKKSQLRFFLLAFVLLILVYNLASGLVLYWTGSNIMSLALSSLTRKLP